jgi:hypothetical protein
MAQSGPVRAMNKPELSSILLDGVVAGVSSAALNALYFFVYPVLTGFRAQQPTLFSVVSSSALPLLVAAAGYFVLSRLTNQAATACVVVTLAVTVLSFEGVFRDVLPDGTSKPAGFDGLVIPMHVVVGAAAVLLLRRFARTHGGGRS